MFCILLHKNNLFFNGYPYYNVSYYNYNSIWHYYIVIHCTWQYNMWHFQVEYGSRGEKLLHCFKLCIYDLTRTQCQLQSVTYVVLNTTVCCIEHCTLLSWTPVFTKSLLKVSIYWHLINNITHTPKTILACENVYTHLKNKEDEFWKTLFTIPFISTRDTRLQSLQYKILHRTLPCNEWLNNIKIKSESTCSYCNEINTITHFVIDCISNKYFWKSWARWWYSITDFNIGEEQYIYESILFGFPGDSDNTIVTNYSILYAKQYIYFEKLTDKNKWTSFNVDFLGFLSHLKHVLKLEENIC